MSRRGWQEEKQRTGRAWLGTEYWGSSPKPLLLSSLALLGSKAPLGFPFFLRPGCVAFPGHSAQVSYNKPL